MYHSEIIGNLPLFPQLKITECPSWFEIERVIHFNDDIRLDIVHFSGSDFSFICVCFNSDWFVMD